jgi:hypothetical protein
MSDVTLSAVDFLRLTEEVMVARVDLSEVGRRGVLYVKELTAAEKTAVLPRPKGKARMYKDQSMEIDWSQLSPDATAKFLKVALLVDDNQLESFFADGNDTATVPADGLALMYDRIVKELDNKPHLALEKLGAIPNAVGNLLMRRIREISGLEEEPDEDDPDGQKKS